MSARTALASALVVSVWLGCAARADAHRLDEYLQTTRLSIDVEQIRLEIDLTPGAGVAPQVFALIDTDHDAEMSNAEREAYSREVLRSIVLSVDDKPIAIALEDSRFPEFQDMNQGVGTIRLHATAAVPSSAVGRHAVSYVNNHGPVASAYLVNALVPVDSRIEIAQPRRDVAQRALTLEYRVAHDPRWAQLWWSLTGVAIGGFLVCTRWRRTGLTLREPRSSQRPSSV